MKAENPYERFTVTLPPEQKQALDKLAATKEMTRSETLSYVLDVFFTRMTGNDTGNTSNAKEKAAPKKKTVLDGKKSHHTTLPLTLSVVSKQVPRGIKWKPEKYQKAEDLLSQGEKITRLPDSADYQTETGGVMSWRTVAALVKLGVLA